MCLASEVLPSWAVCGFHMGKLGGQGECLPGGSTEAGGRARVKGQSGGGGQAFGLGQGSPRRNMGGYGGSAGTFTKV